MKNKIKQAHFSAWPGTLMVKFDFIWNFGILSQMPFQGNEIINYVRNKTLL